MNMRGMNVILVIVIILTILPVCTQAQLIPHSIAGTVYLSDGVTQAPAGTNFNVTDTTSGDYKEGTTGGPYGGGYAATINGEDGDTVIMNAWNATYYGTTTITLSGAMTGIDVVLDIPVADTTPPASVSNLDETNTGTTWILWEWTNPSDSDFNHTKIYIDGVFKADVYAPNNSYNAAGLSPDTTYTIGTRTVDDSGNTNTGWVNDTATTLSLAPPSAASTTPSGAPKNTYRTNEDVYTRGSGFTPGTSVKIHVVPDRDWNDGDSIPQDVTGAVETVPTTNGDIAPVLIWHAPLTPGSYDIVIDADQNGYYNAATDGLDSGSPGFVVVADAPQIPAGVPVPALAPAGIIALAGLLCVIGVSRIRRRFN